MFSQTLTAQATSESNKKREAFAHHRGQKGSLTPIFKVRVFKELAALLSRHYCLQDISPDNDLDAYQQFVSHFLLTYYHNIRRQSIVRKYQ